MEQLLLKGPAECPPWENEPAAYGAPFSQPPVPPSVDDLPPLGPPPSALDDSFEPDLVSGLPTLSGANDAASAEPPVITTSAVRIVRALAGTSELRLLSERANAVHQRYMLETATIAPYSRDRSPLMSKRKSPEGEMPMTMKEALRAFDAAVGKAYPPVKLQTGRELSTSVCAL